jgi:hypothetical protein
MREYRLVFGLTTVRYPYSDDIRVAGMAQKPPVVLEAIVVFILSEGVLGAELNAIEEVIKQ